MFLLYYRDLLSLICCLGLLNRQPLSDICNDGFQRGLLFRQQALPSVAHLLEIRFFYFQRRRTTIGGDGSAGHCIDQRQQIVFGAAAAISNGYSHPSDGREECNGRRRVLIEEVQYRAAMGRRGVEALKIRVTRKCVGNAPVNLRQIGGRVCGQRRGR